MNQQFRVVTACSGLLLAGVTIATDSPGPTMPGTAGDSYSYKAAITLTNKKNGVKLSLRNGIISRSVIASDSPTTVVIEQKSRDFEVAYGSSPPLIYAPISTSYCADGTVNKIVEDESSASYRLLNLETIKLPASALNVGLSWSWSADANETKGTPAISAIYSVIEDGIYQRFPAWKIGFSNLESGDIPGIPPKGFHDGKNSGTVWLRKSDLVLLGVSEDGTWLPVPGPNGDYVDRTITTAFIPEAESHAPVVQPTSILPPAVPR